MFRRLRPAPPEPTGPDRLHYRSRREGTLASLSQCALGTFPTGDQKPPELGSQLPSPWKAPPSHVKLDCSSGLVTLQAVGLGHRPDPWERGSPSGQRGEGLPGEALSGAVGAPPPWPRDRLCTVPAPPRLCPQPVRSQMPGDLKGLSSVSMRVGQGKSRCPQVAPSPGRVTSLYVSSGALGSGSVTIVLCGCCSRWGSENAMKSLLWGSWGSCDCGGGGTGRKNPCKLTF